MRKEVERKVAKVAAAQHGAIGRSQALALCASAQWIKTKVAKGAWRAPERAVYVVSGTPSTWHQRVMIAVLAAGPGAVAAGRTAGRLHGLLQHAPSRIEVVVPGHRHPRATKTRDVSRTRTLRPCDVTIVSGIPTTSAPRTLVDLAGVLDIRRLASAFDTALTSGRTSIAAMRRYLAAGGVDNWRGIATVRRLLDDREFGVPASELEREFERLIGRAALPKPVRQRRHRRFRVDYSYVEEGIAIEVDGRPWHTSKTDVQRDRRRQNEISLDKLLILRFTWDDVTKDVPYVVATIRRALDGAGGGS